MGCEEVTDFGSNEEIPTLYEMSTDIPGWLSDDLHSDIVPMLISDCSLAPLPKSNVSSSPSTGSMTTDDLWSGRRMVWRK